MPMRPDARLLPVAQTPPATHPAATAHLGRQHLSGQARAQHEKDAGQRGLILDRAATALSAIVILAATLSAVPSSPAIGLVLVLSVDWFIGMARAVGDLIGNCVATVVVAAWEGDLDKARARAVLDNPPSDIAVISAGGQLA